LTSPISRSRFKRVNWQGKRMSRTSALALTFSVIFISFGAMLCPLSAAGSQPDLKLYKTASASIVTPGDALTYQIYFQNLGPQISPIVWINDTLPSDVIYVNDTAYLHYSPGVGYFEYSMLLGNVLHIKFNQVPPGNQSFVVFVTIGNSVFDGQVLTNRASMNYTNNKDVLQPPVSASASVTVSMPVMQIGKSVEYDARDPSKLNFTLTISNTGSATALSVWVNDTLPAGVQFESYQAPPGVTCVDNPPGTVACVRGNFAVGNEVWRILARMTAIVPPDVPVVNWAFLNATDQDGSLLPQLSASASFTSRTALMSLAKIVDQRRAIPGSNIHYFIYYNSSGPLLARNVWINDTLPTGVSVVSTSPTPVLNSSGHINWYFSDVTIGSHAVNIEVSLSMSLGNGVVLTNQATMDYFDQIGRKRPRSTQSASTTVTFDIPSIRLVKTANVVEVAPGGQVLYTIYYNNTGNALAKTVTIEDTIPAGVQIIAADPAYSSFSGNRFFWNLQDVPPGSYQIAVTIRVDVGVADGTTLTNTASITYTDTFGQVVGSNFMSVIVTVRKNPLPPPDGDDGKPGDNMPYLALAIAVTLIAIIGLWFFVARRGGDAVIDDVFLLHRDGLLIRHFTRKLNPDVDSDILGGMLIAVQNFVNESFASDKGLAKEGGLDELKFGKYSILIARGMHVVMAAVVLGGRTVNTVKEIKAAIEDLEKNLGAVLEKWSGDMGQVAGADEYIQDLMAGKYKGKAKSA
jgi:uncharacterized repeat protein (TIGR01451 family)